MNKDFENCVKQAIDMYPYTYYDDIYDAVCDAMDKYDCDIKDVERVSNHLTIGCCDYDDLFCDIITDLRIDRIIVPRIHAMLEEHKMTPKLIAKVIYDMLCKYVPTANDVILTVLAELSWNDIGHQVIPYILPEMLAKYATPKYLYQTLGALYRDGVIGGESGEPVTLYRGVCDLNQDIGTAYSYTTDYNVAYQYATGEVVADRSKCGMDPGLGKIYTVRVDPKYIIGRYYGRGESNIMVLPLEAGGAMIVDHVDFV